MPNANYQTAIIQSKDISGDSGLPVAVAHNRPVPCLKTPFHVLVRVLAVGLIPADHKFVANFYMEDNATGVDFCGIIEEAGLQSLHAVGTRVAGGCFPYLPGNRDVGAFAEYTVADSRHLLRVPNSMTDLQAAALGHAWSAAALAISDPDALNLSGFPSKPSNKGHMVLVYGGATATGILAIQMLKRSGYCPIAVCSAKSAPMVKRLGAIGTASYTSLTCADDIKQIAGGKSIKYALDCITDAESVAVCFTSLARVGSRYACLEAVPDGWITRRAIVSKVVMGFEGHEYDVDLGHPVYSRKASPVLHEVLSQWTCELQQLIDGGHLKTKPIREKPGGFEGIIGALKTMKNGELQKEKIVVAISS
ncbi:GroES-like protein [Xylaria sp. FL0933]|nr:GroES-like protein [Xylaria sp. FL0933]